MKIDNFGGGTGAVQFNNDPNERDMKAEREKYKSLVYIDAARNPAEREGIRNVLIIQRDGYQKALDERGPYYEVKGIGPFWEMAQIDYFNCLIERLDNLPTPAAGISGLGACKPMDWHTYGIEKQVLKSDGKTIHESADLKEAFLIISTEYPTEFPAVPETLLNNFLRTKTGKPYGKVYCQRVMTDIKQELKKQRGMERKPLLNNKK
ncbi:hypothetical protein FACS1894110_24420 [Spirochaetia bacterium]|nr:hypothetical protein FACS1894110_24420 [Spirochaetia bacterium]